MPKQQTTGQQRGLSEDRKSTACFSSYLYTLLRFLDRRLLGVFPSTGYVAVPHPGRQVERRRLRLLFQPISTGKMDLEKRLTMAPMRTNYAGSNGEVTRRLVIYHTTRARGGVGLINAEATAVDPSGVGWVHNLNIYDDEFVPGLTQLVEAIHAEGVKAPMELFHSGRRASSAATGSQPVAPSALPCSGGRCLES